MTREPCASRSSFGLAGAVLAFALAGCTLSRVEYRRCDDHAACRDTFGVGFACTEEGFCEQRLSARCTRTHPVDYFENPEAYSGYLPLGVIVNRSLEAHEARANAVQIVAELANTQGGFGDRERVAVVVCTSEEDPALDAATPAEAVVQTSHYLHDVLGAPAILGPTSSALLQVAFEARGARDLLFMSMSATSAALTALEPDASDDAPGLLWRTAVPDTFQARAIIADLRARGKQRVAVVHQDDNYGTGLANALREGFVGAGESAVFQAFSADPRGALEAVAADATLSEVVFVGAVDQVRGFLQFVSGDPGFNGRAFFVTDTAASVDLFASPAAPDAVYARVRGTRPGAPTGSVNGFFRGSYLFAFQQDPDLFSFVANAYDAAFMVVYGAVWAAANDGSSRSGRSIARGLRQLSAGVPVALGATTWPLAVAELEAGRSVDLEGASGDLDIDPVSEELTGDIEVWTIDTSVAPRIVVDRRYSAAELSAQ